MLIDDVAADFPHLTIVMAHPSVPWQDEAISIATHKANIYIDLSGWSPTYFPPQLVRAANSYLRHKVLFGSDFPVLTPDRWLADFDALDIKASSKPIDPQGECCPHFGTQPVADSEDILRIHLPAVRWSATLEPDLPGRSLFALLLPSGVRVARVERNVHVH